MSRKERLQAFMNEKKKDKKSKLKLGRLSDFNVSGLESIIPTLHMPIDAISSGIPKGVIYEFWGEESAGKSSTLGKIFENWKIALGEEMPSILYVDAEGTFNYKFFKRFRFLEEDDVLFYKESVIENVWNTIDDLVQADAVDIIVIDSLTALQTIQEDDKTIDQNSMATMPRKINTLVKKFYQLAEESGLTVIIINSSYTDVNAMSYGPPKQILRGGGALRLGKSCSVKIVKSFSKSSSVIKKIDGEDVMTEVYTKYIAEKNKIGVPKKEATTFLNVDPSINMTFNYAKDVLAYATKFGFIEKGGAWLTAVDSHGNMIYKCQGGAKMAQYIEINPSFYIKLKMLCYSKIYQPFEFYFHFDKLKKMLYKEFESIQIATSENLRFTDDISESDKVEFQKIIDEESDLLDMTIEDILTKSQIDKAIFELDKFYDEDRMEALAEANKLSVDWNKEYEIDEDGVIVDDEE